eukprot:764771-Rhodomonas_salina.2
MCAMVNADRGDGDARRGDFYVSSKNCIDTSFFVVVHGPMVTHTPPLLFPSLVQHSSPPPSNPHKSSHALTSSHPHTLTPSSPRTLLTPCSHPRTLTHLRYEQAGSGRYPAPPKSELKERGVKEYVVSVPQ